MTDVEKLPVNAATCTVNGSWYRQSSAVWRGLALARAEVREQSTLMLFLLGSDEAPPDHHLRTPWMHPDELAEFGCDPDYWCFYRVRPRMAAGKKWRGKRVTAVKFEKAGDDEWELHVSTVPEQPAVSLPMRKAGS